jgi:hypothetical protein
MVSRVLPAAVLGAALVATLAACGEVAYTRLEFNDTENVAITEIRVEPGSGDLTVKTGDTKQVEIRRMVRYRSNEPDTLYKIEGTTLVLATDCGNWCSVTFEVTAPKGVAVRGGGDSGNVNLSGVSTVDMTIDSGNITVTDATGKVTAQTDSGNVIVRGATGGVDLKTGSGNIDADRLGGPQNTARADSGNIGLELITPGAVTAQADSGNIRVRVPSDSYQVDARTDSGRTNIEVPDLADGKHLLDLSTDSGNITVNTA